MKDLVIVDKDGQQSTIPAEEVKKYIAPNATDGELWMFLGIAKAYNLNPFKREIHFVKYKPRDGSEAKAQVIIGYEVYLKRAMATGLLEWWKVTIEGETAADMVAVFKAKRSDWTEEFEWRVYRSEFDKGQSVWKTMPKFMLCKVAIGQGMRLLLPEDLGGMPYSPEEINGHTSEQINAASVVDAEFEDVDESQKVEPEEDEKAKVLQGILQKIASFKTIEALEKWAAKQNIEKSLMKDDILKAIEARRIELEKPAEAPETPEAPEEQAEGSDEQAKGGDPKPPEEPSEEEKLFAQIREVLEAAGHDKTYIENRMHGLQHQKVDALKQVLATEKKRTKNGNGNGKA